MYDKRWSCRSRAQLAAKVALPPIVGGWEGDDQVGQKGQAELGDDLAAPVVTGKGTIVPWQPCGVAPVGGCVQPSNGVHSPPVLAKGTKW
jgi:hypothetical protein